MSAASQLLDGPFAIVAALAFSVIAAWKAAALLEVGDQLAATGIGAALALVCPYLLGDFISQFVAGVEPPGEGIEALGSHLPRIGVFGSRVGFALVGVLCWTGYERVR